MKVITSQSNGGEEVSTRHTVEMDQNSLESTKIEQKGRNETEHYRKKKEPRNSSISENRTLS